MTPKDVADAGGHLMPMLDAEKEDDVTWWCTITFWQFVDYAGLVYAASKGRAPA